MREVLEKIGRLFSLGELTSSKEGAQPTYQVEHGPVGPDGKNMQIRDNLTAVTHFGFASSPPLGARILSFFLGGDRSNGVGFGSWHPETRPSDLVRGDACLYDNRGRRVWLTEGGVIVDGAGGPVTVKNATTVRLECTKLEVTGDIVDNCDGNDKTLKDLRDAYNAHKHTGVQTGASSTAIPDHLVS